MTAVDTKAPVRSGAAIRGLAIASLAVAIALATYAFVLVTPFGESPPESPVRNDDAVQTIRFICFGVIGAGTIGALLASTRASFKPRPRFGVALVVVAAATVLAAIIRIFQTVGI